jgi:hypothetical protein
MENRKTPKIKMNAKELIEKLNQMIDADGDREVMIVYDRGCGVASVKDVCIEGEYDGDRFIAINTEQ